MSEKATAEQDGARRGALFALPARHRRLTGADAGFLYVESESQTSACVDVVELEPAAPGQAPLTRDDLINRISARISRAPYLARRLDLVPGSVGHAVWSDDPTFDVAAHVHTARIDRFADAAPLLRTGDHDAALDLWLAGITADHLDLSRPAWELTLLTGFPDGRQVLVWRFHHTLGDGGSIVTILRELCDDAAATAPLVGPHTDRDPHPSPRPALLFAVTLLRQIFVWISLLWLIVHAIGRVKAVRAHREAADVAVPRMAGAAPRTVLNVSADTERALAVVEVPLAELRAIRAASGASLSDVLVASVAGGLRTHLSARGALPDEPLVVNVPLGHDDDTTRHRTHGNHFVNYYAYLPTHLADPLERLRATSEYSGEAKVQLEVQGRETLTRLLNRIPGFIAWPAAQKMAQAHRAGTADADYNVLVSNVPVSRAPWTFQQRPVRRVLMIGPVTDGYGLNVTVAGYAENLQVAIHANPAAVPDVGLLARQVEAAITELSRAVQAAPAVVA